MVTELTMYDMEPGVLPPDDYMHIVMFYGKTCGACVATFPYYETISNEFQQLGAKIKFYKIDAWSETDQREYCKNIWEVGPVPTFKIFCGGRVLHNRIGGGDEKALRTMIEQGINDAYSMLGIKI